MAHSVYGFNSRWQTIGVGCSSLWEEEGEEGQGEEEGEEKEGGGRRPGQRVLYGYAQRSFNLKP